MKKTILSVVAFAQISAVSAAIITVPNGDFGTVGNNGSIQSNGLGGGTTATPLGSGPWNAQTIALLGVLAPPTATIGSGHAQISGLLGQGVAGQSNSAQFYQTLSGISYLANTTYTLSVDIDSGAALSLSLLGTNGIGIALTRGGNTNVVADSSTASLFSLVPLSGTTYQMILQYVTTASPPSGNIGIRLYAGVGATGLTANLLGIAAFDNVSLTAIPEPASTGFALVGLLVVGVIVRKRAIKGAAMALAMFFTVNSQAALLPGDVSTNAVSAVIALLTSGDSLIQILN